MATMWGRPGRGTWAAAAVGVAAAGLLVTGTVSAAVWSSAPPIAPSPRAAAAAGPAAGTVAAPAATTTTTAPPPPPSYIATLSAATSYSAVPGGAPVGRLAADNPFGAPQVLAVLGVPDGSGWLHVEVPVRPNGTTGWIPSTGVSLTHTRYRVLVDRSAHTVTVTDGGRVVLTVPAAVGSPSSPTPGGTTYLWELIRPDDPAGAYGPYIFGLAEFSDTYAYFNGGIAQIGMHGQDEPSSVGRAVSHGCVRLANGVITELAGMLPLGTPVTIS